MKTAIYARVSTKEQQTLPLQIKAMREYVAKRGWTISHEFKEVGSGANNDRPKRDELLKLARQRKIDAVVVMRLDRWGRNFVDIIKTVNDLVELDVVFVSIKNEYIDMTSPHGKIIIALFASLAETERAFAVERIKEGMEEAKAEGRHIGRPKKMDKYREDVEKLFYKEHQSQSKIAKKLKISRHSVQQLLKEIQTVKKKDA